MRERTGSDKETVAKKLLKQREGDSVRGVPITPQTNRCTFDDLAQDVLNDYRANQRRTIKGCRAPPEGAGQSVQRSESREHHGCGCAGV